MVHRKPGSRHGSLQFWPRKRSDRFLPRVNWDYLAGKAKKSGLMGFIGYKVGMKSAYVKDNTPDSMTKNRKIIIPVTIIECPPIKILSVRFYKNGIVAKEILNDNLDKELKKRLKLPKIPVKTRELIEKAEKEGDFEDMGVIVYSQAKKTEIKKIPDIAEIGLKGTKEEKLVFVKEHLAKEMGVAEVFEKGLVDIRGVTRGKGTQGPVKRFGVRLRSHKAEKGQRKVGSIGPWHPARLTFKTPMAGQMGFFMRLVYNSPIIAVEKYSDKSNLTKEEFKHYGYVKNDCLMLAGSVQGTPERPLLITSALRPTKKQAKKQFELIELR